MRYATLDKDTNRYNISAFLIAQFGKNNAVPEKYSITGNELMDLTFELLKHVQYCAGNSRKGVPYVRYVNAYYENGAFYVITYALSNKIKHLENNPVIAIAGGWFTAHGKGINLGYFGKEENHRIAKRLKEVFSEWIDNGHTDLEDENTVILCVELTDGLLLSHGTRYEF